MGSVAIEKTELNIVWASKTKIKNFKFSLIFLHFNFQIDTWLRKNFLKCLSTWASSIDILSYLKSNDPTVITRDYVTF